jgi:hypothetical protein
VFGVWKKEVGASIVTNDPLFTTQTQQEILNSCVSHVCNLNCSTSNDAIYKSRSKGVITKN